MTDAVLLNKIKSGLGIAGDFQNDTIQLYIDEVKSFMLSAGVSQSIINSTASVGCVLQGVNDLWNYSSGANKFSEHFFQRLIQLSATNSAKPIMETTLYIPTADEVALFGWISTVSGLVRNLTAGEFTVNDEETISGVIYYTDGTEATAENDGTGNRRRLTFPSYRSVTVMPDTIYDTAQSRFIDNDGTTAILVPLTFYGATLKLDTVYKE